MNELKPPVNEQDHHEGPLDAPTVLVVFGDYQCPDSKRTHSALRQFEADLGEDLCLVYRHFPLDFHEYAEQAAEAAEAAAAQQQFARMHDLLFHRSPRLDRPDLLEYAEQIGLDVKQFEADLESGKFRTHVRENATSGRKSGVKGTPTFFLNGQHYGGKDALPSVLEALKISR